MRESRQSETRRHLGAALGEFEKGRPDLAEAIIQRLLSVSPQNVEVLFALGMVKEAIGDPIGAIEQMQLALKVDPRYQSAIERLALLYMQINNTALAERYANRGLLCDSRSHPCLMVLGQCYAKQFRMTEALDALGEAARLSTEAEVQIELGEMQFALRKVEDSLQSFSRALAVAPSSAAANVLMARALTELNRIDEADWYWSRSEATESFAGQTRLARSLALALVGRFADAEIEARRAIELNPTWGKPYHVYFGSKRVTAADQPYIDRIEELLRIEDRLDFNRVDMLYALGKAYDDLGEYERAISWFDQANALVRRLNYGDRPFDRLAFRRTVDNQIDMYPKEVLTTVGEADAEQPIFVMGMIRSGTTLVDQILSSHRQVGGVGEQGFWLHHENALVDYERKVVNLDAAQILKAEYKRLLSLMAPGFSRVIDKNPANVLVAGLLHTVFPSSRMICTRRHAVDTALSIWMTQMKTSAPFVCDRGDIVFAYKEFNRLAEHWREAMPEARYLEIRYESLIDNVGQLSREMVEFCGLEWDDSCLHPERNSRTIRTPSFWQARQPVFRTSVDRWKRYEPWLGPFEELVGL